MGDSIRQNSRRILDWAYQRPGWFPALTDSACWGLSILLAGGLKQLFYPDPFSSVSALAVVAGIAMVLQVAAGRGLGPYRHRWRIGSFDEVLALGEAWAVTTVLLLLFTQVLAQLQPTWRLAAWAVIAGSVWAFVGLMGTRVVWRRYWEHHRRPDPKKAKRTLVFGAGDGADHVIRLMLEDRDSRYLPVAILDDHPTRRNRVVHGVPVKGSGDDLSALARSEQASVLLVAVRNLPSQALQTLSRMAHDHGLELLVLPSTSDLVGSMKLSDLRPPTVEELLRRDPVDIDLGAVADTIRNRRVLITGAGGSIGSELSRLVSDFEPSELCLLDRDESALHSLQLSMEGKALLDSDQLVVANIRDRARVFEIFENFRPHLVFHAAALKHLTLLERHPVEAIKTNVLGTKNLLDAAVAVGVERFVNISTDKAADPTSVLGASKLAAEHLTALASEDTGSSFVSVRFGNVLGSRGSVLPTFLEQIRRDQPITVTDPNVTRYFMTIPEAVRLVLQAAAIGRPGEVLILDMGEPVRIVDLARQLVDSLKPGHPVVFTGLRPGEKLHEVLISASETVETREHPRIFHTEADRAEPESAFKATDDSGLVRCCRVLLLETDGTGDDFQRTIVRPETGVPT